MSSGNEAVTTYLDALLKRYDKYSESDFFSLILCGTDLNNPYDGLSGICCNSVFDDFRFRSYFGDFPDSLMEYENVAEFLVDRTKSKLLAVQEFITAVTSVSKHPVFVSSNAATWALPALQSANAALCPLDRLTDFQVIDLRKLYSFVVHKKTNFTGEYIGSAMDSCPQIPKTFGLHRMAADRGVRVPDSGTKAEHRANLTAELSADLLQNKYEDSSKSEDQNSM